MENLQTIRIDIRDNQTYEQIYAKQYNRGYQIQFEVTKDDEPIDLTGVLAAFQMKKPDGYVVITPTTIEDNIVSVEVTEQMTVTPGKCRYQLSLVEDETVIATVTGIIKVDESTVQDGDVESQEDLSLFQQAIEAAPVAVDAASRALASATAAHTSEVNAAESVEQAASIVSGLEIVSDTEPSYQHDGFFWAQPYN